MKEKFNSVKNEIAQRAEFNTPSRKTAVGAIAALAVAAAFPSEAKPLNPTNDPVVHINYLLNFRGALSLSTGSETAYQKTDTSLNVYNNGFTECKIDQTDEDNSLKDSKITLRVDKAVNHKWVRDTRFKEKTGVVKADADGHQASGSVSAGYNVLALANQNSKHKMRIACEGEKKYLKSRINLDRKFLQAYAKIEIGNSTTNN